MNPKDAWWDGRGAGRGQVDWARWLALQGSVEKGSVPWLSKDADFAVAKEKTKNDVFLWVFSLSWVISRGIHDQRRDHLGCQELWDPHRRATCHQSGSLRPLLHHTEAKSLPCGARYSQPTFSSHGLWFFSIVTQGETERGHGKWTKLLSMM